MAIIGGLSPLVPGGKPGEFKMPTAEEYNKNLSSTLTTLGFSPEYAKEVIKNLDTARKQYEDYLKKYLGGSKMKDEGGGVTLQAAQLASSTQGAIVMQQVALASLFPGWGSIAGTSSAPPAEKK